MVDTQHIPINAIPVVSGWLNRRFRQADRTITFYSDRKSVTLRIADIAYIESYLVNADLAEMVSPDVVSVHGTRLPVSRKYKEVTGIVLTKTEIPFPR